MRFLRIRLSSLGITALLLAGLIGIFGDAASVALAQTGGELVVFSGRKEPLLTPIFERFEDQTGIRVNVKYGTATQLAQEILQLQQAGSQAPDIFISNDAGTLEFLRVAEALQPYSSEAISQLPASLRAQDGSWVGISGRSRAILYNKALVNLEDLPDSIFDLTDPKWKGKIAATDGGNESFVAWVSALRLSQGEETTRQLLEGLKANEIALISNSHTDIRKAVGRGEYALGLINHYYYHLQLAETDSAVTNVGIIYPDQATDQIGTFLNAASAGILKGAKNLQNAQNFLNYLASVEAQKAFAEINFEYPLLAGVATEPSVLAAVQQASQCQKESALECLKLMPVSLDQLGEALKETQKLLEEVDWF